MLRKNVHINNERTVNSFPEEDDDWQTLFESFFDAPIDNEGGGCAAAGVGVTIVTRLLPIVITGGAGGVLAVVNRSNFCPID